MSDEMNETSWDKDESRLTDMELVVEGVAIPVVTILGMVGNILSIIVLHSPGIDMKVRVTGFLNFRATKKHLKTNIFNLE